VGHSMCGFRACVLVEARSRLPSNACLRKHSMLPAQSPPFDPTNKPAPAHAGTCHLLADVCEVGQQAIVLCDHHRQAIVLLLHECVLRVDATLEQDAVPCRLGWTVLGSDEGCGLGLASV